MTTTPDPTQDTPSRAPADAAFSGEDEDTLLRRVCQLLVTALPVAAAAVALVDERLNLTAAAASPQDMRTMIAAQFASGEGPCLDACRTGEPIVETDIAWSRHWAAATTWRTVHTLPVRINGRTAAAATLASLHADGLTPAEISTAHGISATAAAHASTIRALRGSQQLAAQLQHTLHSRVETEQAKGVIAHQLDVTIDEAYAILHRHAHNQHRPLTDIAYQVITGNLRLHRHQDNADTVTARDHTDTPPTGSGWPRNLLSIIATEKPGSARLVGEADLSTEDQLAHALKQLARQPGDITLDIADLRLIDARSVGLLIQTATALPPPHRLVLHHPTGIVAKVITLLDISDHPHILIT